MASVGKVAPAESVVLLREHLGDHPEDLEAQVALANSYRGACQLNQAIAQFTSTLGQARAANDDATAQICVKGLQDLRLAPSVAADTEIQKHEVNLRHKGQGFHIGDLDKSDKNQAALGNSTTPGLAGAPMAGDNPLNINFLDPPPINPLGLAGQAPNTVPDYSIRPGVGQPPQSLLNKYPVLVGPVGNPEGTPPGTPPGEPF
jgi:hypothetical protein